MPKFNEEYFKKQEVIKHRINELFLNGPLVAEYDTKSVKDKIILKRNMVGEVFAFDCELYISSNGKHKVTKYDFTNQRLLNIIDNGTLTIISTLENY
jgi:hypothetical protein